MKSLLKKYFITTLSIYSLTQIMPTFIIEGGWGGIFRTSLVLSILLYIGRPIISLFALPLNILTLNFFSWIINIGIIYLWTKLASEVKISSWQFKGLQFGPIIFSSYNFAAWEVLIIGAVMLTLLIIFFEWLIK